MSIDEAAKILVDAIRGSTQTHVERTVRPQVLSATVVTVDPLEVDLHGSDLTLDADDLTVPTGVTLVAGDVVTINEVGEGDFHLVAVQGQ